MSRYSWEPEAIDDVHARGIEPYEVAGAGPGDDFEYWIFSAAGRCSQVSGSGSTT